MIGAKPITVMNDLDVLKPDDLVEIVDSEETNKSLQNKKVKVSTLSSVLGSSGHVIQNKGVDLPTRGNLNFVGLSSSTDQPVFDRTNIYFNQNFDQEKTIYVPPPLTIAQNKTKRICLSIAGGWGSESFSGYSWTKQAGGVMYFIGSQEQHTILIGGYPTYMSLGTWIFRCIKSGYTSIYADFTINVV